MSHQWNNSSKVRGTERDGQNVLVEGKDSSFGWGVNYILRDEKVACIVLTSSPFGGERKNAQKTHSPAHFCGNGLEFQKMMIIMERAKIKAYQGFVG